MLTFTPANALIPQVVTVTAVTDMTTEGPHLSTISHTATSADARYNGLAISNVVANITEQAFLAGDYNSNGKRRRGRLRAVAKDAGVHDDAGRRWQRAQHWCSHGVVDSFDYSFWMPTLVRAGRAMAT